MLPAPAADVDPKLARNGREAARSSLMTARPHPNRWHGTWDLDVGLSALVPDPLRRAIGDAAASGRERRPERSFGAGPPAELCPGRVVEDRLG